VRATRPRADARAQGRGPHAFVSHLGRRPHYVAASSGVWWYIAVASSILAAFTVPLVAGARLLVSVAEPEREEPLDELDPEQRTLIERFY
jgi:hypothetical protein